MALRDTIERLPGPRWAYTALTVAAILYLTLTPRPLPEMDVEWWPGADKMVHAVMFGAVVVMAWVDDLRQHKRPGIRFLALSAAGATLLGGIIEVLQANVVDGRSGDLADLAADAAGAILAALLLRLLKN